MIGVILVAGFLVMPGETSNTWKVTIAVAAIGAIATIGAAYLANSGKSKDQPTAAPAGIQQTSSGAGAINVGHDAVINNVKSPGEESAELVQACEQRHGMKTSTEKAQSSEKAPTLDGHEQFIEHIDFRSCTWPKTKYSDGDGFMQISVRTEAGPGEYEATGTTYADRIKAPCEQLIVGYGFGSQGTFEQQPRFTIKADTVVTGEDQKLWKNDNTLPFYPDAGEFVVLHNSHDSLQTAQCAP